MSNKSTPVQQRIHQYQARALASLGANENVKTPATVAVGLRRKVLCRTPKRSTERPGRARTEQQMLNTGFRSGISTPQPKPKPTSLNACYTPSSLYRGAEKKTTPLRLTPCKNKSASSLKERDALLKSGFKISEESSMIVAVRVRPLNALECIRSNVTNVVHVHGNNELSVQAGCSADASAGVSHFFSYNQVFNSSDPDGKNCADQQAVFAGTAQPLIDIVFEGYNACLFAYGQTGSGKSYCMMGIEALDDAALDGNAPHVEAGIIPRFCHELFRRIDLVKNQLQVEVEVSYFEIYNEKIHDLLSVQHAMAATDTPVPRQALKVREHPNFGPYVVDLSAHSVDSYLALRNWLAVGNSQRATASTAMNDKSSRSHSIFNIVLNLTDLTSDSGRSSDTDTGSAVSLRQTRRSKISLVDLAGSERISSSGSNGERIREGVSINKSLLTLGKVIAALADARKPVGFTTSSTFVPYRESVLTWLLRENLGGNSKTVMLATISPASIHADETLATLRYACKARSIVNRVKVNESPHDKVIRDLRAEVDRLKSLRNEYERQRRLSSNNSNPPEPRKIIIETSVDDSEVEAMRQQLAERERELNRAQKSWMEKLKDADEQRKSELRLLKRKGLAMELTADQKQACLVNLTADPMLSGTLFYVLPVGTAHVGRGRLPEAPNAVVPDIVLDGPLVGVLHCSIDHERSGRLFVSPGSEDFETYVNGELLEQRRQLFNGDRLVIGGSHYFRISNPFCSQRGILEQQLVDFQLAHQEIMQKQQEQLRNELEEEKRAALSNIEMERFQQTLDVEERLQCLELEQFKYKCNSEMLETERQMLAQQQLLQASCRNVTTSAQRSTLLEDVQRILLYPSEESLHRTQLMVKEATQRCRQLGQKLEFRQIQTPDEFGLLRTVILVVDKRRCLKAEWPIARLGVWLDQQRDANPNDVAGNIFSSVEVDWEPLDADLNETLNDTNNSSRIGLNLSSIKDVLLKQPLKRLLSGYNKDYMTSTTSSASPTIKLAQKTKRLLTYELNEQQHLRSLSDFEQAQQELQNMQRAAMRFRRHCEEALRLRENQAHVGLLPANLLESLALLDNALHGMHNSMVQFGESSSVTSPIKAQKAVRFLVD